MGFVRKIGRAFDDAVIQPVVNTVEKIVENPEALLGIAALAVGVPAIGGLLGGGAATAAGLTAAEAAAAGLTAAEAAGLGLTAAEAAGLGLSATEFAAATGGAGLLGSGAMTAAELAQADLALGGLGGSAGAAELGSSLSTGLLGSGAGEAATSGLLNGMTEAELAQLDMSLGGAGGSAGAAELEAALATGAPTVTNTALTGGSGVFTGAAGGITPDSVAAKLAGDTAGATASKFPLSVSDTIRLAGIGATLAGGAKLAGDAMGGSGGYDIVPIPSDWTSPIKPTGIAEFTPLAPIDFGNKEMLQGTQWEKLLDPNYGKAPPMPSSTNPSNMNFDQLMGILGNSKTSIPTQSVSINDVIAGIQSQYGQAPQGSMG